MSQLEILEEIRPKAEGTSSMFDTKLCHMGRELDPNFSKLSNSVCVCVFFCVCFFCFFFFVCQCVRWAGN